MKKRLVKVSFHLNKEQFQLLNYASQALSGISYEELLTEALNFYLDEVDPMRQEKTLRGCPCYLKA